MQSVYLCSVLSLLTASKDTKKGRYLQIKEIKVIEGEELVLYTKDYVKRLENL